MQYYVDKWICEWKINDILVYIKFLLGLGQISYVDDIWLNLRLCRQVNSDFWNRWVYK